MLKLIGSTLYQWDLDRQIEVTDDSVSEVHFAHMGDENALVVEVDEDDGVRVANIPNILLQSSAPIKAWLTDGERTICGQILTVIARAKPSDYVYTETEIKRYETLEARIEDLENSIKNGNLDVDLSEIEADIENLQEDVSKISEEVADLKENGSGGGASLDVQIGGTSIVENGIATIPMASKDSFGVSKMFPTNDKNVPGVGISGNGVLGIVQATNANIDAKTTSKPITPSNLDYAIKSGLTTNALEWTEEEKAFARDLIGAVDSGVEITDGEPTKETTVMTLNPNAEEVHLYTAEEIDAKFDAFINAEEVAY